MFPTLQRSSLVPSDKKVRYLLLIATTPLNKEIKSGPAINKKNPTQANHKKCRKSLELTQ